MSQNRDLDIRTVSLVSDALTVLQTIETRIPDPYSVDGLYRIFADGYLPVPYLWECRDEFRKALAWQTRMVQGGVKVINRDGTPVTVADRMHAIRQDRNHA
jgi:hypothetical protein